MRTASASRWRLSKQFAPPSAPTLLSCTASRCLIWSRTAPTLQRWRSLRPRSRRLARLSSTRASAGTRRVFRRSRRLCRGARSHGSRRSSKGRFACRLLRRTASTPPRSLRRCWRRAAPTWSPWRGRSWLTRTLCAKPPRAARTRSTPASAAIRRASTMCSR
eukprot:Amastigsp_a340853_7.p4 type:complete len:162 gc:universal Amastigsp_a340853_7:1399-914(-)